MNNNGRATEVNFQEGGNIGRKTEVNLSSGRGTTVNSSKSGRSTEVNASQNGRSTEVNDNGPCGTIAYSEGQRIGDYMVVSPLNPEQKSGEALLYLCIDPQGGQVVVKFYHRTDIDVEGKKKLARILNGIKNVQTILDSGTVSGHFYEVMPYYEKGSLRDRMKRKLFSEQEITQDILPRMVDILESLHQASVYHSDIKPENIMYANNGKDLILIDFGVSVVVAQGRQTTILTEVGGTADYRAPETHSGILIDASDYYSLGITLFALMVGRTPTDHLQHTKDVERTGVLSVIPRVNSMSERMYQLIDRLTYRDIRYRHDRSRENRWIAEDVREWLAGEDPEEKRRRIPVPEIIQVKDLDFNLQFRGQLYARWQTLVMDMAKNWNAGKQFLLNKGMDSLPNNVMSLYDRERSNLERKAALGRLYTALSAFVDEKGYDDDGKMFIFIYQFCSGEYGWGVESVFWKGMAYASAEKLGDAIYNSALRDRDQCLKQYEGLFVGTRLMDLYFAQLPDKQEDSSRQHESLVQVLKNAKGTDGFKRLMDCCFALRKDPSLQILPSRSIKSSEDLKRLVMTMGKTPKDLQELYQAIMSKSNGMLIILTSWLNSKGVTNFHI